MTDEEVMQRIACGDAVAGSELVIRYRAALVRFATVLLHDSGLAEDAVNETFRKLAARIELPSGAPRPWLYKVTRNECLDQLRRRRNSPTGAESPSGFDPASSATGIGTRVARAERDDRIREAIWSMPDDYREVVVMKFYGEFSREEIAEILGESEAAVKGRLARGLEYLRQQMRTHTESGA